MEHYSNVVKAMIARSNARAADIADKIQARAYYQFQYVPPAGPLPGWSMEQQTEDAINEIGNIAYSSDEIAREAREIAQQAYNAAQAAIEMATNALTAAQNAQQTADTALNTANTAVTKADNAQASADAAQKAAAAAQKSANDAQTAADNAQSTADTAIENASQALSAANEAKASADQSNQRLDILEPIVDTLRWYENVTDNIDFNTRVELERAFLQGTANTNGPVAGPGWLDVDDDYNETYIRHKFIAQADGACYVRFGTIVPDSSPIEVSSWTGWVKYALASELTSALSGYAQLNAANTFTAANTFNSNIVVRAATAAGSAGVITLGEKPSSKTAQCLINAAGNGDLILQASENGIVGLQSGSVLQWSVISDEANTKTSAYLHSNLAATYTPATGVVWEGNANTATKLATARTINGVPFDGTKDITIDIPEPVIASEAEAKAGTDNTKFMTPLRVKQATSALAEDILLRLESGTKTKEFTASDSRWTESNGMWRLTMAMGNSRLIGVYKEVKKPQYEMVLTGVYMDAENVIIEVPEKFAGIVILASLTKKTGDKVYVKNFTDEDFAEVGSDFVLTISAEVHQAGNSPVIVSLTQIIDGVSYPYYANAGVDNNGNVVINVSKAFTGKIILDGGYLE